MSACTHVHVCRLNNKNEILQTTAHTVHLQAMAEHRNATCSTWGRHGGQALSTLRLLGGEHGAARVERLGLQHCPHAAPRWV